MEWTPSNPNCQESTAKLGTKRAREEGERQIVSDKRGCDEPMSWWTCLMLGVSSNRSRIIKRT